MARSAPQSGFRWNAWLKLRKRASPVSAKPTNEDASLTAWCVETAKALGLSELSRKVHVYWNPRMRTTAGRAWWPDRTIEMNPKLHECGTDELWRTLKHELAHLIAYERSGRRKIEPHGVEWRAACAELGIANEKPYHNLPFKRRKMKRNHAYVCPHCEFTIHRVKPIRRAVACYTCCRKYNGGVYHEEYRLVEK